MIIIPSYRNPRYNSSINPRYNSSINPCYNSSINPRYNSSINPCYNSSINPRYNSSINPCYNSSINPRYNSSINPRYNSSINPRYNSSINPCYNGNFSGLLLYDLQNNVIGFAVLVENRSTSAMYLIYDENAILMSVAISNSQNGFNIFSNQAEWLYYWVPTDSGYNQYNLDGTWNAFVVK